jgi:glycosyltransferase involved in cell wall biosynthesis
MLVVGARRDDKVATSVLVDARELTGESAWSGIGTTIRGLLGGLSAAANPDLEVRALVTPAVAMPDGIHPVTIRRLATNGRRRSIVEHQLRLPLDLVRHRADVFHNPTAHPPAWVPGPWVQTLFDVIPLVFPDPNLDVLRRRWQRLAPRYRRADVVAAISRHAADEGIRHLGLDPARVEVVHLGVDPAFAPGEARLAASDPPFVLLVSEYSRRKGFEDAFAVAGLLAERGLPHRLRVAGRIPPHVRSELDELVAASGAGDRIDLLGFVDDLPALYRDASLVLIPSRYEGFGLPALEAMASGTPVLAYDNTSLPEIVGSSEALVPDGDVAAMAKAAEVVLTNAGRAEELAAAGLERAAAFTWAATASAYADLYRHVAHR